VIRPLLLASLLLASVAGAQEADPFDVDALLRGDGEGLTATAVSRRTREVAPSLDAADAQVRAAQQGVAEALTGLFPSLTVSARYTRLSPLTNDPLVPSSGGGDTRALVAGVDDPEARQLWTGTLAQTDALAQSSIPVFLDQLAFEAQVSVPVSELFLTLLPRLEAAEAAVDAARAQQAIRESVVDLRARSVFYGFVRARAFTALSAQRLVDAEEQHRLAEAAAAAGAASRADVLGAAARLAAARAQVEVAQAALEGASEAVRALTHLEVGTPLAVAEDVTAALPVVEGSLQEVHGRALGVRPEVEALRRAAVAQSRGAAAAEGARWPVLRFAFNAQLANPNARFVPQRERFDGTWDASVVLAWSPNGTVVAEARARAAHAEAARLEAELAEFEDGLRSEVAQAWADDRAAASQVALARAQVAAAAEAYRARRRQVEEGVGRFADVLEAESQLTAARAGLVDAAVGARLARVRLAYATGGAIRPPGG
jgi:outer membrane protein TolC